MFLIVGTWRAASLRWINGDCVLLLFYETFAVPMVAGDVGVCFCHVGKCVFPIWLVVETGVQRDAYFLFVGVDTILDEVLWFAVVDSLQIFDVLSVALNFLGIEEVGDGAYGQGVGCRL